MGQLEKYGLYVLCLVIFLILGVTIWGGGDAAAPGRSSAASGRVSGVVPAVAGGGQTSSLDILVREGAMPRPRQDGGGDVLAGNTQRGTGSTLDALLERGDEPKPQPAPGPAPEPKPEPKVEPAKVSYTVLDGDTLESIARTKLGKPSLWTEIQRLNPTIKPEQLKPGQEIQLPTAAGLAAREADRAARASKPVPPVPGGRSYTVKKGDSFERIALNVLGSRKRTNELIELNPSVKPEAIRPGDTLKLPVK